MIYTQDKTGEVSSRQPTPDEIKDMVKDRSDRIKQEVAVVQHDSEHTDIQTVTKGADSEPFN
jgi:hypothetical protein